MKITITHLTRMKRQQHICVAGITEDGEHRRPVLTDSKGRYKGLRRHLLKSGKGCFELGAVVDLGKVKPRPCPPETEDVDFDPFEVEYLERLNTEEFLRKLDRVACDSLRQIFGPELQKPRSMRAAVPEGRGNVSLGVLRLRKAGLRVTEYDGKQSIRLEFEDPDPDLGEISLSVTDLRLWESDHQTPEEDAVDRVKNYLDAPSLLKPTARRGAEAADRANNHQDGFLLAVGLGRAWKPPAYDAPWHWLQVNNIYPRSDPLWERE